MVCIDLFRVEKHLKPLCGTRGELTAVCDVGTTDSEHQQLSDQLRGESAAIIFISLTHSVSLPPSSCPIITGHENQSIFEMMCMSVLSYALLTIINSSFVSLLQWRTPRSPLLSGLAHPALKGIWQRQHQQEGQLVTL